jgi:uncharacterized Zn-binding protein involved in type VI secretion
MPKAARLTDPISHSPVMSGLLIGLLVGAAIGIAVVGTGGLAAVAIVGASAAAGAGIFEVLSTMSFVPKEICGAIAGIGSPNVFTNSLAAARANLDFTLCSKHPGPPIPISTGSSTVFINGQPAARVDDTTFCGAVITTGSNNVYIGGGVTGTIRPENLVPGWVHATLLVIGVGGALVGAAAAVGVLAAVAVVGTGTVLGIGGGYLGAWLGGKLFGQGSDGQKALMLVGTIVGGSVAARGATAGLRMASMEPAPAVIEPPTRVSEPVAPVRGQTPAPQAEPATATPQRTARAAKELTAAERAQELHSLLDARAQRARTTAVTETEEGIRVVSSSERRLSPAQRNALSHNEVEGAGVGHAEVTGVNAAKEMGLTPKGTAASRPICSDCASHLEDSGIDPLSPLK